MCTILTISELSSNLINCLYAWHLWLEYLNSWVYQYSQFHQLSIKASNQNFKYANINLQGVNYLIQLTINEVCHHIHWNGVVGPYKKVFDEKI